jgi:hypothetical protein
VGVNGQELSEATKAIVPELAEAIRQEKGQVDVNVLLRVVVEKAHDPEGIVQYSEQILRVAERYEDHRLKTWQQRAQAVIDVKSKDPDEIEKRQNNQVRRGLKITVGACAVLGCGGAVVGAIVGAGIVVTGMLATIGAISLAMLTPLASGESVSSNDTVRILEAVKNVFHSREEGKGKSEGRNQRRTR